MINTMINTNINTLKTDRHEYRITVNDYTSPTYTDNDIVTELWDRIISNVDRVINAKIERRFITDISILPTLTNYDDIAIKFRNTVIFHWETIAELK